MRSAVSKLVSDHGKLARIVLPISIAAGFAYTVQTGRHALVDFKSFALGEEAQQSVYVRANWPTHWP